MGIVGGAIFLLILTAGFWVAVWAVIGIYCGRRWGVNEVGAAVAGILAGPVGMLCVFLYSRRARRPVGESRRVLTRRPTPATARAADPNEIPDF